MQRKDGELLKERNRLILEAKDKKTKLMRTIDELITQHYRSLNAEYLKSVYQDSYENKFYDKWHEEIDYFINNVLKKNQDIASALEYTEYAREQRQLAIRKSVKNEISEQQERSIYE
ncbi:MAG: hypothetical protein HOP36_03970 [Methyloglobulus sp.]|nr:hypothetical protein [Methyloglobulus sp.]